MKITFLNLSLLFICTFCNAQNRGIIIPTQINPQAGIATIYKYQPPQKLLLPKNIEALVVYQSKGKFYGKYIPLKKVGNKYQFVYKAPDSTAVLIMGIVDKTINHADFSILIKPKKKVIDNNNDTGFIFYLRDKEGKRFSNENIILARLLSQSGNSILDIKLSNVVVTNMYEEAYKLHPELVNDDSYLDYLKILYREKKDIGKFKLITYANQLKEIKNNEAKWLNAISVYQLLKMDDEQHELENMVLSTYPNGELAKQRFWDSFYSSNKQEGLTEQSVLDTMNYFFNRFKDTSENVKNNFYGKIISILFDKKQWSALLRYEQLSSDKFIRAYGNDKLASKLVYDGNGSSDLEIAKILSQKSLNYVAECIETSKTIGEQDEDLEGALNKYTNTYAFILYSLGEFDSAYYFQNKMFHQGNALNIGGLERYAIYAEKVKGPEYARQVIEHQLLSGINSAAMQKQLQSIYKKLGIPEDAFNKLQEKNNSLAKQRNEETIIAKLGTISAKDFVLKNILGQMISLSSFKNKVVVLDFWATWCGPCKASFPAMKKLMNKYKDDTEVVFLFIDVWEKKEPLKIQEEVVKFLKDNNYTFNVLFDVNDNVVNEYKIGSIPTKFIIDKKGNIVFIGDAINDISVIIEAAKK
jgi:thiol-disulfide isomerase/thioredoxin